MLWIIVILICCLKSVESEQCKQPELIIGRLGNFLVFSFQLSDLKDEYRKYMTKLGGKRIKQNEIQIQDLQMESDIRFKKKKYSMTEEIIFKNGSPTQWTGNWTEIFMTNDSFVVKKTKLHKKDAGIYWISFLARSFGYKTLIISGKPKIIGRSPANPVLKPEDKYTSIIQLECDSVSTSIGDCLPTLYIVWYKNGMRISDVDTISSQINVTVDHNGGIFTCLTTDYPPCYQRLQTLNHDDVWNIEECKNVFESETFKLQPQFGPVEMKLEPDQREITVEKNEDLKVRCSAKCHPKCDVTWGKDYQVLESSNLVNITENIYGKDLEIKNFSSTRGGGYVCLTNNIHGEVKKGFTLSVTETEDKAVNNVNIYMIVIVIAVIVVAIVIIVAVVVVVVIIYKKYHEEKSGVPEESSSGEDEGIYESVLDLHQDESLPVTSTDNDSRNGEPGTSTDSDSINSEQNTNYTYISIHTYDSLDGNRSHGGNPDPESGYSKLYNKRQRQSKTKLWYRSLLKRVEGHF